MDWGSPEFVIAVIAICYMAWLANMLHEAITPSYTLATRQKALATRRSGRATPRCSSSRASAKASSATNIT